MRGPLAHQLLKLRDGSRQAAFERATREPAKAQSDALGRILRRNAQTAFGKDHGFGSVSTPKQFASAVPVTEYEAIRPYVTRMLAGESGVLTAEPPLMFDTTSGTTGEPKYVPVPAGWCDEMASLTRIWMLYALRDHPAALAGRTLVVASPAVEGYTAAGVPVGALSGLTYQRIPWLVRRQYAIPYAVALIDDPDQRYFMTMRAALQHDVSAIGTPNATTLLRLAEVTRTDADRLLAAIERGTLGVEPSFTAHCDAGAQLGVLRSWCVAAPERARALAAAADRNGALTPAVAWPRLTLIGCWLGGSAGVHARRLGDAFGDVPLRDLGLLATEGRITLPIEDADPAGVLCVDTAYFEFVPESDWDRTDPALLTADELEDEEIYQVVITGSNGLYRYNLRDVVQVRGFHNRTPRLAFLRKAGDFVSVTGEKVHLDQVQAAVRTADAQTDAQVWQFQLIPDVTSLCHDLLLEPHRPLSTVLARQFLAAFDEALAQLNLEYSSKRRSGRLRGPRLFLMRAGWADRRTRRDIAEGRREPQYKWMVLPTAWDEASRREVEMAVDTAGSFLS
ncbi:MAG TPA: GH3 auxin-responsive promoter family protein [Candidatus Dormibacteraeota bacterium]